MPARWYLSPYVTVQGPSGDPTRVAQAGTYPGVAISIVVDITGAETWALCLVNVADHAPLLADATLAALPDYPLDTTVGALTAADRTALRNALTQFGITRASYTNASQWRAVLSQLATTRLSTWTPDAFLVTVS